MYQYGGNGHKQSSSINSDFWAYSDFDLTYEYSQMNELCFDLNFGGEPAASILIWLEP